ncbi:uncharacterized protein LOC117625604 [Prunus dulcis]|uniref:uncharacterized protein LOC117625604 n=1 Tax=Prunus dulcis TaxID=3755 RepID=UPI001483831E|nr:uncharacterized protein LOC117625604 [Prunus dulcis]
MRDLGHGLAASTSNLLGLINGTDSCPTQYIPNLENPLRTIVNPEFLHWFKKDQTCKIWIHSSLSESILPYIVGSSTSQDLWLTLEKRFAAITRSHLLQLKARIQNPKKGSLPMLDYLQLIKHTADSLAAAGAPLDPTYFIAHVLNGLLAEYDAFATSIRVRSDPVEPEELHGLLLSEEMALASVPLSTTSPPLMHFTTPPKPTTKLSPLPQTLAHLPPPTETPTNLSNPPTTPHPRLLFALKIAPQIMSTLVSIAKFVTNPVIPLLLAATVTTTHIKVMHLPLVSPLILPQPIIPLPLTPHIPQVIPTIPTMHPHGILIQELQTTSLMTYLPYQCHLIILVLKR